jgi:hypothetical protein
MDIPQRPQMSSTYASADSQARLELTSPTVVRDWRAETNKQIRLNYEDQDDKWQELLLYEPRQLVLPISTIAKAPTSGNERQRLSSKDTATPGTSRRPTAVMNMSPVSTDSPTGVEDMESVDSGSTKSNDGRGRHSDGRGVFVGVAKGNGAEDGGRSKSPDVSIAESTGTFLSKISDRYMKVVKETQPLGGPKYYIATNTKKGRAKVVHEAMPATGREGFKLAMEERGYEIIEYDMLPGEANKPSSINSPSNSTLMMDGSVFLRTNPLTSMFKSRQELPEKQFSKRTQRSIKKTKESSCLSMPHTGCNSFRSWFNDEFNKFLDVADKIDHAITGCTTANSDISDYDGDYSPTDEEESVEDVEPPSRYKWRSSRHRRGRSRSRRR